MSETFGAGENSALSDREYLVRCARLKEYANQVLREKGDLVIVRKVEIHRPRRSMQGRLALERATRFVTSPNGQTMLALRDRYKQPSGEKTIEILTTPANGEETDIATARGDIVIARDKISVQREEMPEMLSAAEAYVETIDTELRRHNIRIEHVLPDIIPIAVMEEGQVINLRDSASREQLNYHAA